MKIMKFTITPNMSTIGGLSVNHSTFTLLLLEYSSSNLLCLKDRSIVMYIIHFIANYYLSCDSVNILSYLLINLT